jgi:hypothetical protein
MRKKYFGGGTIASAATDMDFSIPRPADTPEHFEDGTSNFYAIAGKRTTSFLSYYFF